MAMVGRIWVAHPGGFIFGSGLMGSMITFHRPSEGWNFEDGWDDGTICSDREEVSNHIVDYYKELLGSTSYERPADVETISNAIHRKLSQESIDDMSREVTDEEIREVMWSLPVNKAPGPDGAASVTCCCFVAVMLLGGFFLLVPILEPLVAVLCCAVF
ncbi:rhamnogalacturonan endolyase [Sarracenia purpurea var. burkii]